LVFSAFVLFTLYNDYQQRQVIRGDLQRNLHNISHITAENIENWLGGRITRLKSLADVLSRTGDSGSRASLLQQQTLTKAVDFIFFGSDQRRFDIYPTTSMPVGYDPRTRPWYSAASGAGKSKLTEPYIDANTGQLIMTIATPVKGVGVVGADLNLQAMISLLSSVNFDGSGYAFLVNGEGKILVHPDRSLMMQPLQKLFPAMQPEVEDGTLTEAASIEGDRIVTFMPVQGLPDSKWYVGISIDRNSAFGMLMRFGFRLSAFGFAGHIGSRDGVGQSPWSCYPHSAAPTKCNDSCDGGYRRR
jgi:methyl-accepting chemotaxis protein